ncbi:MAG: S8 family serine peptidase [Chloroflexota bacterium]
MSRPASILSAILLVLVTASGVLAAPAAPTVPGPAPLADAPPERSTGAPATQIVPGQVAVRFRDPAAQAARAEAHGLAVAAAVAVDPARDAAASTVLDTHGRPVDAVVAELLADPSVAWAEPVYVTTLPGTVAAVAVNDPRTAEQYSLDRMKVREAWSLTTGGATVVAVLDTGLQWDHPDLQGIVAYNTGELGSGKESNGIDDDGNGRVDDWRGWDFVGNDNNPAEDNAHGTWVSGIIAATENNGVGVAGVSWSDKVLPVKIMNASGTGDTSDLVAGIDYAVKRGAKVINMSIAGFPYSQAVQDAINRAWTSGAILVAAAGNYRTSERTFPADFANVVGVSATQADDEFTNWSNFGSWVEVSAPGAAVLTTNCTYCNTWGPYAAISGTSFSSPNVAGVVSLMRARFPAYTNRQIVDRLYATVDDLGYSGRDARYGIGRVNAYRAVGGSPALLTHAQGDSLESNNTFAAARALALGTTIWPSNYPAADVDYYRVTAPRAGRIDVAVSAIVDTARPTKSALPFDPVVQVYDLQGTLLATVDNPSDSSATERASVQLPAGASAVVRVANWFPNGSREAYSILPTYVDNVAPALLARSPAPGADGVDADGPITVQFSEPVTGVGTSTMAVRDSAGTVVPASVRYDAATRVATLLPTTTLPGFDTLRVDVSASVRDLGGNAYPGTSWTFRTRRAAPRIGGTDRYDTAARLSASHYAPGAPVVYVATGAAYPDALSGGAAAALRGGPLLLTRSDSLPGPTAAELARLRPGRIVVLGGPSVVGEAVVTALRTYTAGGVSRIAGIDRYDTAARISAATFAAGVPVVYLATGATFPDALAGGAAAARQHGPILLTRPGVLPPATIAELQRLTPGRIVVLGGPTVVGDGLLAAVDAYTAGSVTRLYGEDRYATSVAVSAATYAGPVETVFIATGTVFPDGLAAGPVAGGAGGPLLLVRPGELPAAVLAELRRLAPSTVVVIGSSGAVGEAVRTAIEEF